MFSRVLSAAICGIQGLPIFVEADVSEGLPGFSMVGDLSAKVKEAQDRVMTAFRNSGIQLRPKRITVNLSPADIHKDGSGYDLPVALAILAAYQLLPMETLKGVLVAGELGLNGAVKGIKGALPIVQLAKKNGCHTCILPERNRTEGEMVSDIHIVGVSTLKEVLHYLQKGTIPGKIKKDVYNIEETEIPDFADIHGQSAVRRAAEIAAGREIAACKMYAGYSAVPDNGRESGSIFHLQCGRFTVQSTAADQKPSIPCTAPYHIAFCPGRRRQDSAAGRDQSCT